MAPNSEICDWQLRCSELKQRGAHLLQSGEWSDCSFLVGSDPQVIVPAHKLILAMASPVFEAMFYGGMAAEGNKPIPILDIQPEAFKALLEYIYTDNVNINSFDAACDLCYGAKKYMLPHLVKQCTRYLWPSINPKNACQVYEFARLLEVNVLMEKCLQVISLNTQEVLKDSSFNDVDYDTMKTVFSLEHLNIGSELELFEAAMRHVEARDQRQAGSALPPDPGSPKPSATHKNMGNTDSSADNSSGAGDAEPCPAEPEPGPGGTDPEAPRPGAREKQSIRGAVEQIRFLTLSPQQFAEGPARSPLLAELESFAVFMHLSSSRADVPLPRGFSASRDPRKEKEISISEPFADFICYEFDRRDMTSSSYCRCVVMNRISVDEYAAHYFCHCARFIKERLDFMVICQAYKVEPFSTDVKNHEETNEALGIFIDQIKSRGNAYDSYDY